MNTFIFNIINFIKSLNDTMITNFRLVYGQEWYNANYLTFLNKNIINGDLLNISLTWGELFNIAINWFLVIFFIVFFINIIFKVIKLICIR